MNVLFVIGLPRSGTSLVHKKVHEETGRKAIYLRDLGLEIPDKIKDFHKVQELAEIHDIKGDYKEWMELRGIQLAKSVELAALPSYMEAFPEALYLVTVRSAQEVLSSVQEYFQVTGLRWPYNPTEALKEVVRQARTHPERFDYVEVEKLPEWESDREPVKTFTSLDLDHLYDELRGIAHRVTSEQFKERYS